MLDRRMWIAGDKHIANDLQLGIEYRAGYYESFCYKTVCEIVESDRKDLEAIIFCDVYGYYDADGNIHLEKFIPRSKFLISKNYITQIEQQIARYTEKDEWLHRHFQNNSPSDDTSDDSFIYQRAAEKIAIANEAAKKEYYDIIEMWFRKTILTKLEKLA